MPNRFGSNEKNNGRDRGLNPGRLAPYAAAMNQRVLDDFSEGIVVSRITEF